ncbi:MAG: DUF2723 domain-containing protein [bacterium]
MEVFGDGTEFSISVATLGISHPPSYPLFIILAKLFYFLPFGSIAFKVNLFSSLTAALAGYAAFRLYKGDAVERWFLGIALFFSRSFFINAVTGEVYALNLLFFILIIFLLRDMRDKRLLYLAALLLGLGSGNHHTLLFLLFYVLYICFREREMIQIEDLAVSAMLFILGFSVYLYLPLRAMQSPLWNWGNPVNLELFLNSFFRHDFKPEGMERDIATFLSQLVTIDPFYEFGYIAGFIFVFGMILLYRKDKKRFYESLLLFFLYSLFIVILLGKDKLSPEERKETYAVFFIPAYFVMVYATVNAVKDIKKMVKVAIFALAIAGLLYNERDQILTFINFEKNAFAHDLSKAKLISLPDDGVLITTGGEMDFPIFYQQAVGKFRENIKIINLTKLGKRWNAKESLEVGTTYTKGFEGETNSKRQILKAVILFQKEFKNRRVFLNIFDEEELPETLKYSVNGLFYEYGDGAPITLKYVRERSLKGAPFPFVELIKAAKDVYEANNNHEEVERADKLLKKMGNRL